MADIRPQTLDQFIGQEPVKIVLGRFLADAKARGVPAPHFLFTGAPGLGKSTLSGIVANEMGGKMIPTTGLNLKTAKDVYQVLLSLNPYDVLFCDEIHETRLPEALYTTLESGRVEIPVTSGKFTETLQYKLPSFTMIGATTNPAELPKPLLDRFTLIHLMGYTPDEMYKIVARSCWVKGMNQVTGAAVQEIVNRSRYVPRVANGFVEYVRVYAKDTPIDTPIVEAAFAEMGVDSMGLNELDRKYLRTIIEKYDGGKVGLETLAASMSEDAKSIYKVVEPYLLQQSLVEVTRGGRIALPKAYTHLGYKPKDETVMG